jgi:hypothetical protein
MRGDRVKVTWKAGEAVSSTEIVAHRDGGKVEINRDERRRSLEVFELGRNNNQIRKAWFNLDAVIAVDEYWASIPRKGRKSST